MKIANALFRLAVQPDAGAIATSVVNDFFNIERIIRAIAHLGYTIMTWALSMVDFIFVLVRELCGINTDFSSLESVQRSDVIFGFIFSPQVVSIIRNLIIFAIVLILVFGIIAIIKNEYEAVKDTENSGEIKNSKGGVWKNIFQSLLLLFLIPMILFGGIILSNGLLQTLYNYTAGAANQSIGSQIFMASSYDANNMRTYARNNKKIPITYNFNQIRDYSAVTDYDSSGSVKDIEETLDLYKNASVWTQGLSTFWMFYSNQFLAMDGVDKMERIAPDDNAYQSAYDGKIKTYAYEYYVNADMIDYMMRTGTRIYYKTAKEVYDSCKEAGVELEMEIVDGKLTFVVNYDDDLEKIRYSQPITSPVYDEADGAVFIACVQDEYASPTSSDPNATTPYYRPLVNGKDKFSTYYMDKGDYVVARGLFDSTKYPTAIRKVNGKIEFYRDKLNIPTFSSLLPHLSYGPPDGSTVVGGGLIGAIQYLTGVDISQFLPFIYFDFDVLHLFSKTTNVVSTLADCSLLQDYTFKHTGTQVFLEVFALDNKTMELTYDNVRLNWIVLVLATVIILGNLLKAFIGLMRRTVDIMILYVMYPAAVSTIPLYGNSSIGTWTKKMFIKVTSMYGLVVGINLGLMLLAPISELNLITPDMLSSPWLNWLLTFPGVNALNYLVQILFFLVGFVFIFKIPRVVQAFVQGESPKDDKGEDNKSVEDVVQAGGEVIEGTTAIYKKASAVITGKALLDKFKEAANFVPGGAIVKDLKNKHTQHEEAKMLRDEQKQIGKDFKENLANISDKVGQKDDGDSAENNTNNETQSQDGPQNNPLPNGGSSFGNGGAGGAGSDGNEADKSAETDKQTEKIADEQTRGLPSEATAKEDALKQEKEQAENDAQQEAEAENTQPQQTEEEKQQEEQDMKEQQSLVEDMINNGKDSVVSTYIEQHQDEYRAYLEQQQSEHKLYGSVEDNMKNRYSQAEFFQQQKKSGDEAVKEGVQQAEQKATEIATDKQKQIAAENRQKAQEKAQAEQESKEREGRLLQEKYERIHGDQDQKEDLQLQTKVDAMNKMMSQDYNNYLQKNNFEDTDENNQKFFESVKDSYMGGEREQAAEIIAKKDNGTPAYQNAMNYAEVDKEGYQKFLKENGGEDNEISKAQFFVQERNHSQDSDENREKYMANWQKTLAMNSDNDKYDVK